MIEGISHITFIVKNLDKTAHFFQSIFDDEEVYSSSEKTYSLSKEKFFLINGIWIAIMEGDPIKEKSYNHVAFKVASEDFQKYVERVNRMGVEMKEPRNRV